MLSIKENYKMTFKENWDTHNIWVDITGTNFEELEIMRKYILKGFDELKEKNEYFNYVYNAETCVDNLLEGETMSEIYIVKDDCCNDKLIAIFTNEDDCDSFIDMNSYMYQKIKLVI